VMAATEEEPVRILSVLVL